MRDATRLHIYFKNDKALFLIPLYQRKYAWQKKHCQRLFADLIKVHNNGLYSHFFGSIVSVKACETEDDLLIIDGQQRITTVSLLILAAINAVKNGVMQCENEEYVEDTKAKYLIAKYRKVERKIKLRPIDDDMAAYDALFTNDEENYVPAEHSGITSNYMFFYNLIASGEHGLTFENLIEAIEKLIIIDICLDSSDNPQLIFESLNSCGKDLEEADKVRNYLLMSLTKDEQESYYYTYWNKIEKATDGEPTLFIRDYLTIKRKVISSFDELYFDFKQYDEDSHIDRKDLLADMLKFAKYYRMAGKGETGNANVDKKLRQLASIGSNVCMPFYMAFLDYANDNCLSEDLKYEVFDIIENYWARRIMCGWPANVMMKTFALLHSDILRIYSAHQKRGVEVGVTYADIMKYIILKKQGTGVFPSDSTVSEMFPQRQVYKMPPSYRAFIMERMENLDSKEGDDHLIEKMAEGKITIEHIMPQHLSPQWKKDLGEHADEIHEKYLHTIANLTLTGYNQDYGNRPYSEKWNGYIQHGKDKSTNLPSETQVYGFKDSAFKLSNYLKLHQTWTEEQIIERGQLLLQKFLCLWPMITTQYTPLEKEVEVVSFDDDDVEFAGRDILGFRYHGTRHQVSTWKEFFVELCKQVYDEKPTELLYLATKEAYFHTKTELGLAQIAPNCYVWTANGTNAKRTVINYLFKETGITPSDLEVELVPENDNSSSED